MIIVIGTVVFVGLGAILVAIVVSLMKDIRSFFRGVL